MLSDGRLAATPHYVSGGSGSDDVSRETFAFFLQYVWLAMHQLPTFVRKLTFRPDVDDVIGADDETFGQFTKRVLERHYADGSSVTM